VLEHGIREQGQKAFDRMIEALSGRTHDIHFAADPGNVLSFSSDFVQSSQTRIPQKRFNPLTRSTTRNMIDAQIKSLIHLNPQLTISQALEVSSLLHFAGTTRCSNNTVLISSFAFVYSPMFNQFQYFPLCWFVK
jgi:hypothetical protein